MGVVKGRVDSLPKWFACQFNGSQDSVQMSKNVIQLVGLSNFHTFPNLVLTLSRIHLAVFF